MAKPKPRLAADYIVPLYINGLQGRMLRMPPSSAKKREILLVYGMHTSLERYFGLAEELNRYGAVTMPDLPGFGGMQSFYKIGEKPTIDAQADYLASFIKLRYKKRRITIAGMSYGFAVVTRMLQKYPEIAQKVDMLVSIVGFLDKSDFAMKRSLRLLLKWGSPLFTHRLPACFWRYVILNSHLVRLGYKINARAHSKLKDANADTQKQRIDFEIGLWHQNDTRTHMLTTKQIFRLNLCNTQVDLPLYHIGIKNDHFFDNYIVEQHMNIVYKTVDVSLVDLPAHGPTVIATAKETAPLIPIKIRRLLSKQ